MAPLRLLIGLTCSSLGSATLLTVQLLRDLLATFLALVSTIFNEVINTGRAETRVWALVLIE